MYLRTADLDLGFDVISDVDGFLFLNLPNLNCAIFLHVHIANFGSHKQPVVSFSIKFLRILSSI